MSLWELMGQVFANLRANKLRSILTMFGITWGIASVMLLSGIAVGFKRDQGKNFEAIGKDVVMAWGGRKSIAVGTNRKGDYVRWNETSVEALKKKAQYFRFSPEISSWNTNMRSGARTYSTRLAGVNEEFSTLRNFSPDHGRWITKRDCDELRRVCVIGNEVRKKLFGEDADPLYKNMLVNGREFLIIGWKSEKKQDWSYSGSPDNQLVYIPWTTHNSMFDQRWFSNFVFSPYKVEDHDLAVKEFKTILGKVHRFDPDDKEAVNMWDTLQQAKETNKLFDAINYLMVAIGAITLMIGGLGVMNIMIVAVIERTREIGIRRAIGARRGIIIRQFFYECLVITFIAGGAGMLVGWGLIRLLTKVKLPQGFPTPAMSETTMLIAASLIGVVTILSGLYPAIRAARVNPIEALRHE